MNAFLNMLADMLDNDEPIRRSDLVAALSDAAGLDDDDTDYTEASFEAIAAIRSLTK